MDGIGKAFSGVKALKQVSFEARGGEIHALLGANGAGKSTLMKILSGAYPLDEGQIELDGKHLHIQDPIDAKHFGIHCVYQEVDTALVPQLSVAENILLDRMAAPGSRKWVNPAAMERQAEQACKQLGITLSLAQPVERLSLAEKQMVLIARTVIEAAKVVIFDEPTAPLSQQETEILFRVMREMRDKGIVVIFISHRLPEVFGECDRLTVMRDGSQVFTSRIVDTSSEEVISQMLGEQFQEEFPKAKVDIQEVLLEARGLKSGTKVRGVDFTVRAGEIVAIVGLVGAGKTECARLLSGADLLEEGQIFMSGKLVRIKDPSDALLTGIAHIPEERRKQGVFVQESVKKNLSLPIIGTLSRIGFIRSKQENQLSSQIVERFGIKTASNDTEVTYLSGGNQQKVSIGKWVESKARLYIFDEPTKGVDVGAKRDIFRIIGELASQHKGILYFTSELAEAIGIADRIIVMCDGQFVKQFGRNEVTQEQLLFYASAGRGE
ncbi:sugar ABC transporter ATP-binding protein [Paenibacillus sp. 1001270B_150601_E10]|uniref:sugar ABC transporter ATP-binding protein n=1 Tax=Paenibacillus sp. 1001270B_150601_E10 TaxID=2787079 RepID=UPI00189D9D17|nr:sugar ABC transporter ATP-binding protein [Paenibacillus sp. 1001270B_150601_E10]